MKAPASIRAQCGSRRTSHFERADRVSSFGLLTERAMPDFRMRTSYGKDVRDHVRTSKDKSAIFYNEIRSVICAWLSRFVPVAALSRRKHGFDPRWARQSFQIVKATIRRR